MDPKLPAPVARIPARGYRVPRPAFGIDLWLDGNEGPPPPSDLFDRAGITTEDLRRYPDASVLEADLASDFGVAPEQCLVTAGADEAIDRFCRAYLEPGRVLVQASPGFEMVARYTGLAGGELREVEWLRPELPLGALRDAAEEAVALILASPNNPTGLVASPAELCALAAACAGTWLVVDLVYTEFLDEDPTRALLAYPNVLVLRSFSKGRGLAGLRVGYALGPAELLANLRAAAGPYAVSGPSLKLAAAARWPDPSRDAYLCGVRTARDRLAEVLQGPDLQLLPAAANFLLLRSARVSFVYATLASQGIAVRRFPDRPELEDCLRITCPGDPDQLERLCVALELALRPEALLFDLDGVLADVSRSYRVAIQETAQSFGLALGDEEIAAAKAAGQANNDWLLTQELCRRAGRELELEVVKARFEALYQGGEGPGLWREETLLLPAARLRALAAARPLALVTGRPRADAQRFLCQFGIADCFAATVCMEDAPAKPSPEPLQLALESLGCRRAWMLGDTVDDLRAARAAGVLPLAVPAPGSGSRERRALATEPGTCLLPSILDLPALLP